MTDLDKLIAAVEAKGRPWLGIAAKVFPKESPDITDRNCYYWAWDAHRGSLDAAKALHEALLPGWIWGRQKNGAMWVARGTRLERVQCGAYMPPSRALLLATLRAYRSQVQK